MFGFRKKSAPKPCPANPGISIGGNVAFARAGRTWTEHYDTITLAASVLQERGYAVQREKTWLVHPASGFILLPQLVSLQPLDQGGVQTATTIQVNHAVLTPGGIFEYQHSTGDSTADSIGKGFAQWAEMDLVPLLEALQPEPNSCATLKMSLPETDGKPARVRRSVLGPVAHFMEKPPVRDPQSAVASGATLQGEACEEHGFCPCCLLTNSFDVFKELIEGDGFYGLRLFAARDSDGAPQADCRVNGVDWENGAEALRHYAQTWPAAGYEFRKQYVVLQTMETGSQLAVT